MKIAIAGAGIGGLTAALALRNSGFRPELFERSSFENEAGLGLQLSPNAVKVLYALGLRQGLEASGFQPQAVRFRGYRSGTLIAYRPLGLFSADRYGAPYFHVRRETLHRLLREQVEARGIPLHAGAGITDLDQHDDQVRLQTEQGEVLADLAVGADGIHSTVRSILHGDTPTRFTGMVAYRALVRADALPDGLVEPVATVWLGPGAHLVHYYVDEGSHINLVAVVETDDWQEESWQQPAAREELLAAFKDWHPRVRVLLESAGDCHKWALLDRPVLDPWGKGRVTLLGDACHPMLPFLAQGAAMAIEDGWVLSRLLEHGDEEAPQQALKQYEQLRRLRTSRVQEASRSQGEMFHLRSYWGQIGRNLKLGMGCRLLPEIAMAQFDWLHGHDPVRRFK